MTADIVGVVGVSGLDHIQAWSTLAAAVLSIPALLGVVYLFHSSRRDARALRLQASPFMPVILEKSETYLWLSPQMLKQVSLEPSELFFNRPSLVNFDTWESCVYRLQDTYANVGAWGSRYPQHDASDAWGAIENLGNGGLPGDSIARLMGGNAARFYGIEARQPA